MVHLPVPVTRRQTAEAARNQDREQRLRSGFAGEEEDDGEGWLQGLQYVQTTPVDLQGFDCGVDRARGALE